MSLFDRYGHDYIETTGWNEKFTEPGELEAARKRFNPNNQPVGHFTGRCRRCGSKNLWDDMTAYGCEDCGAVFMTG